MSEQPGSAPSLPGEDAIGVGRGGGCPGVLIPSGKTRGTPLSSTPASAFLFFFFNLFGDLSHLRHAGWVLQLPGARRV